MKALAIESAELHGRSDRDWHSNLCSSGVSGSIAIKATKKQKTSLRSMGNSSGNAWRAA